MSTVYVPLFVAIRASSTTRRPPHVNPSIRDEQTGRVIDPQPGFKVIGSGQRRAAQHDPVAGIGGERPQVQVAELDRAAVVAAVGQRAALVPRRHDKRAWELSKV